MTRRRVALTALAVLALLAGLAVVASVTYRVWLPTAGAPNYWEGHTGGLWPLVLEAMAGAVLLVGGVTIGLDGAGRRLRALNPRVAGAAGVVGGLLGYGPVERLLVATSGTGGPGYRAVGVTTAALLAVVAVGLLARYPSIGRRGRAVGGVAAGGFLALAGASLLRWVSLSVVPRTGALSYPPLGVELVGTLAVAAGSVGLGVALRRHDDVPPWLGAWLVAVGLLALPVSVAAFLQQRWADGLVGLAWAAVGVHLAAPRD